MDTYISGELELVAQASAQSSNIRSGGYMILLQEQDSFSKYFSSYFELILNTVITSCTMPEILVTYIGTC